MSLIASYCDSLFLLESSSFEDTQALFDCRDAYWSTIERGKLDEPCYKGGTVASVPVVWMDGEQIQSEVATKVSVGCLAGCSGNGIIETHCFSIGVTASRTSFMPASLSS